MRGRAGKLLAKARRNPSGLAFREFEALLRACGWVLDRQAGSHRLWRSPRGSLLPVQPRGSKAKGYQVRQFLRLLDEEYGKDRSL